MEEEYNFRGTPLTYTNAGLYRPYNPLHRPKVRLKKFFLALAVFIGLEILLCWGAGKLFVNLEYQTVYRCLFILVPSLGYFYLISKRACIRLVHVYQRFASDERRLACLFEPSCSEYMIMAIQKYGTIRGIIKGWDRLMRCHPPNHGQDYP